MNIRRIALWMLVLSLMAPLTCGAEEAVCPKKEYDFTGNVKRVYDSPTLQYTVESFRYEGVACYLTKVWMQDPGRQIRKATAEWKKNIMLPVHMAEKIPEAALVINGSGYVSPTYPWIPEDYPGDSKDYYYTPLGSLTVTDGTVYRDLEGIPYYGLTLEADGLHMYVGAENMTNFKQESPIIDPFHPYSSDFDASMVLGPTMGWKAYIGFRYDLEKKD